MVFTISIKTFKYCIEYQKLQKQKFDPLCPVICPIKRVVQPWSTLNEYVYACLGSISKHTMNSLKYPINVRLNINRFNPTLTLK